MPPDDIHFFTYICDCFRIDAHSTSLCIYSFSLESKTRMDVSDSSMESLKAKKDKQQQQKRRASTNREYVSLIKYSCEILTFRCSSSSDKGAPGNQRDRPSHTRTRTEIYGYYCTFGEKPHPGQDFLSRILNHLRDTTEGLLSHAEVKFPKSTHRVFERFSVRFITKIKVRDLLLVRKP